MKLRVRHETAYTYDQEVQASYNELRLLPQECAAQHVIVARLQSRPTGLQQHFTDYYGNRVVYLEVGRPHRRLEIRAEAIVQTQGGALEAGGRPVEEFLQPGALTRPTGETIDRLRGAGDVRRLLDYESGVTDTATDVNAALRAGRGVCQDFTHVFVTACRLRGVPARYVGGYLLQDGPDGEQQSHAWAEVYEGGAWRPYDPTYGSGVDERYLGVAVGRDYADIPPVKGVVVGAGTQGMRVRLRVAEQSTAAGQ